MKKMKMKFFLGKKTLFDFFMEAIHKGLIGFFAGCIIMLVFLPIVLFLVNKTNFAFIFFIHPLLDLLISYTILGAGIFGCLLLVFIYFVKEIVILCMTNTIRLNDAIIYPEINLDQLDMRFREIRDYSRCRCSVYSRSLGYIGLITIDIRDLKTYQEGDTRLQNMEFLIPRSSTLKGFLSSYIPSGILFTS